MINFQKQLSQLENENFENELIKNSRIIGIKVGSFNYHLENLALFYQKVVADQIENLISKQTISKENVKFKLSEILEILRSGRTDLNFKQNEYFQTNEAYEKVKRSPQNKNTEKNKNGLKIDKVFKKKQEDSYRKQYVNLLARIEQIMD